MRRFSVLLGIAVVMLAFFVGYTFKHGLELRRKGRSEPAPNVRLGDDLAASSWTWNKDDPQTNKPISRLIAQSIRATHDPSTFELVNMKLRLFDKDAEKYTFVKSDLALYDERSGALKSSGPVEIMMRIPSNDNAEDPAVAAKHVRVFTTGVTYETKTGRATTDKPAKFVFPDGGGKAVGADYDPGTKALHLHSRVSMDWIGKGPAQKKLHVDTHDLVYKEAEGKVYMMPSAKLTRQGTIIEALNVVVQLQDGRLHQIDGDRATGSDRREDRRTDYAADKMTALFNENGTLVNIVGNGNAKVASSQPGTRTTLTGTHADMRFAVEPTGGDEDSGEESNLHLVRADGNAVAESAPVMKRGSKRALPPPDTRILRSEHIELEMRPGGKDLQEIRTSDKAQLEFKPNRAGIPHRVVDASHLRVIYGPESYVGRFLAWNVQTRTDKVTLVASKVPTKPPAPAFTWSEELIAKFLPQSNQVENIQQNGNFRYQEDERKASAQRAFLDQLTNRMTLTNSASVSDATGTTKADKILLNQATGDMDAEGHVVSTRDPDRSQKPGTSMLDNSEPMQATAEKMVTRERNTEIHYEGKAVMWQGADRIIGDVLDIDRDEQTLHAEGNVVSELVDNRNKTEEGKPEEANKAKPANAKSGPGAETAPVFTTVYAPELLYDDEKRIAHYTGGVKLIRDQMTITSKELTAYLNPKSENDNDSSLDHAVAVGDVTVFRKLTPARTRTGTGEHCDYFTADDKVVLTGGSPRVVDSFKGVTEGEKLTFFSDQDHLVVDGGKKEVFTEMKKRAAPK